MTVPFSDAACRSAGPRRPDAFLCVEIDFTSDVWMIENFDARPP